MSAAVVGKKSSRFRKLIILIFAYMILSALRAFGAFDALVRLVPAKQRGTADYTWHKIFELVSLAVSAITSFGVVVMWCAVTFVGLSVVAMYLAHKYWDGGFFHPKPHIGSAILLTLGVGALIVVSFFLLHPANILRPVSPIIPDAWSPQQLGPSIGQSLSQLFKAITKW